MKRDSILKAISFASRAHDGQIRKDGETPYASHPVRALFILRDIFGVEDEKLLISAVLHDTIEDTTTDHDDVSEEFGIEVADIVALLSKDKRKGEEIREAEYLKQLKEASDEVKVVKLADVYDNVSDCETAGAQKHIDKTLRTARKYIKAFKDSKDYAVLKAIDEIEQLLK